MTHLRFLLLLLLSFQLCLAILSSLSSDLRSFSPTVGRVPVFDVGFYCALRFFFTHVRV